MGSTNKLALGSAICGGVAFVFCCPLLLFAGFGIAILGASHDTYITRTILISSVTGLCAWLLGTAALARPKVRSGEQPEQTLARVGVVLGTVPLLLNCVAVVLSFAMGH